MKARVALLVLTITGKAFADPPVPTVETVPPGDDHIVVVRAGEKVPFTGQLFDGDTALRWANWLEQYRHLVPTIIEHDQKVCSIKLEYDASILKTEKDKAAAIERDLKERLLKSEKARAQAEYEAQNPPWYRSVWFGVGVGAVSTIAITYAVVHTTK